jgi:hypothetical protein
MGSPAAVKLGPGLLYVAPIGTTEPTTGSGALPSAWVALGYTEDGSEVTFEMSFEEVEVAEELDPVKVVATGRMTSIKFELAEMCARNLSVAFNGGTISGPASGFVTFEPPDLGDETRLMIVWQADDDQERWLFRRCLQVGSVTIARKKAPSKATIPAEFKTEIPPDGSTPFKVWITDALSYDDPHT